MAEYVLSSLMTKVIAGVGYEIQPFLAVYFLKTLFIKLPILYEFSIIMVLFNKFINI